MNHAQTHINIGTLRHQLVGTCANRIVAAALWLAFDRLRTIGPRSRNTAATARGRSAVDAATGVKPGPQKLVADAMAGYVERWHQPFTALLSAGDNFYVPLTGIDDPTWQTLFEKMYDPKRARTSRSTSRWAITITTTINTGLNSPMRARIPLIAMEGAGPMVQGRSSGKKPAGDGHHARQRSRQSHLCRVGR